ncbi:glycosyltransferase family 1 protein [Vibrio cholerae]|nr:glycosyltransferase family 1 protein [Vibrio cholerae]BCN16602.1 putative glycosyltransferase [Vibrio cholerae]GHW35983.1 polysaccharide biosynthesis protein [Vibrio cholerae]
MGGAEHSLYRLMKCGLEDGHKIYLASPASGKLRELAIGIGVEHIAYDFPKLKNTGKIIFIKNVLSFLIKISTFCLRKNIDIVHSNTVRTRFYLYILGLIYKKVKTIAHVRDIQDNPYQEKLIEGIDYTIAISLAVYNSLNVKEKNSDRVKVIHNGVEDLRCYLDNAQSKLPKKTLKIGMVGRIESWKRQDLFIKAALSLLEKRHDCDFYIVGDCIKKEHLLYKDEVIKQIGTNPHIHLLGHVDNPFEYMNMFDLIVCPSTNEPFGRVVIEAMALQKPIIGSNSGGITEIITTDTDKQLFSCGDCKELISRIELFLDNQHLITKVGTQNYINYKSNFSIENNFKKTNDVYNL